ncbi:MAG: ATP-binding protein [Caulobacteraceae bacterium]
MASSVVPDRPASSGAGDGVRLFAASARNIIPRLVHSLALACVGCIYLGSAWAGAWFLIALTCILVAVSQTNRNKSGSSPRNGRLLSRILLFVSLLSSVLNAVLPAAIWVRADDYGQVFAIVSLFIAAAYVLLQYYSERKTFFTLLAPYFASLGYICFHLARATESPMAAAAILLAGAVSLVNFFALSRQLLDRSRSALRRARMDARENEKAAASANEAKTDFLAAMSHEIRTPLNGVLGMTQAMAAGPLSKIQRERLGVVHQSGKALLAILNDILDLSKIEAGKLELEEIDFDLRELVLSVHGAFAPLAHQKKVRFEIEIREAEGFWRGDPVRLRQIIGNLVSNALKFTEQGSVDLVIRSRPGGLAIQVRDTGVGLAADALPRLFDKFSQADASTARKFGGSGLGLAICRRLAILMGGDIVVASELGRGSTFTLELPLKRATGPSADKSLSARPAPVERFSLRLLAAEDNAVNQLVLSTLLAQVGVEPTLVADGAAAVAAWEAQEWDAILMDVQMPVMDGPAAARAIRRREAELGRSRTPIIALTANAMSHQIGEYLAAGMDGHLPKPIEAKRLFETLAQLVQGSAPEEASPLAAAR